MSEIVYRTCRILSQILRSVPVGTNLGLFSLLWALLSGRFLMSRGAVCPALSDLGLSDVAVRRSVAALCYGKWQIADLLTDWKRVVEAEGRFRAHVYEGYSPVAADLSGFFRPHLKSCVGKHYASEANKALPAVVIGIAGAVGSVGTQRLLLPRLLLRQDAEEQKEADLQQRLLVQTHQSLAKTEVLVVDAGNSLAAVLTLEKPRFVVRGAQNFTARRNFLAPYGGQGRPAEKGEIVRPLERTYKENVLPATPPDAVARWKVGKHKIRAHIFENLVMTDQKPGAASFRCLVIFDPRYHDPLVLVTNLPITAYAIWCLYRDRWPVEQLPLAAKPMLGAGRSYVFGEASRHRLPQLALLAGNILSYVAATTAPLGTGFWDRCVRPTCGRLRRVLSGLHFSDLPLLEGQVRKKASVTAHLPKGVAAHRRQKAAPTRQTLPKAA